MEGNVRCVAKQHARVALVRTLADVTCKQRVLMSAVHERVCGYTLLTLAWDDSTDIFLTSRRAFQNDVTRVQSQSVTPAQAENQAY